MYTHIGILARRFWGRSVHQTARSSEGADELKNGEILYYVVQCRMSTVQCTDAELLIHACPHDVCRVLGQQGFGPLTLQVRISGNLYESRLNE